MGKKQDGGPAFPMSGDPGVEFDRGMSLRDWFAGTANDADVEAYDSISSGESRANARYRYADAMLRERAEEE